MESFLSASLSGMAVGLAIGIVFTLGRMNGVLSRTERKVDALLKHSGMDWPRLAVVEAETLARAGKKIEAIKAYREFTGCGLAEAKKAVEAMH